jgi:hypothetical protein
LIPSNGFPLGQQLETVKAGHLPPQLTRRGIDQKICKQLLYLRRTRHRAAQASSTQRLRGAMPGSWRYRRLRAHFRLLTQMPIAAPVNFSGGQVSRNNTNSEIGRTDGLLTLLRHTACKVRWNVAFSYTKGTVRHCLLGNITENEPREATGPRRRLAMACVSSEMGHPRKNNQKKTTNPDGNRFTRHAACPETELAAGVGGYVLEAPVSSAYRFARERIVVPLGSSEWHEPEPGANFGAATLHFGTDGNGTPGRAACWTAGEHTRVAPGTPAADDRLTLGGWLQASATTGNCIRDGDFTSDVHERRVKDAITGHVK